MGAMASHITIPTIVCSAVYSAQIKKKHQSSASLAFVRRIPAEMARYAENVSIW